MSDEVQTPETAAPQHMYPIVLSVQEVQGIVNVLRKLPMEQVEGLVYNITNQFNNIHASLQSTGETK
jgi:hypothetical protein